MLTLIIHHQHLRNSVAIALSLATRNFGVKSLFRGLNVPRNNGDRHLRDFVIDRCSSPSYCGHDTHRANSWRNPPQDSRAVQQSAKWRARNSKRFHSRLRQWHAYRVSIDELATRARVVLPCFEYTILGETKVGNVLDDRTERYSQITSTRTLMPNGTKIRFIGSIEYGDEHDINDEDCRNDPLGTF